MEGRSEIEMEILLSGYRDGELSPDERQVVEEALARDPRLRARLDDMQALGAFVQASLEREADEVDFSGFADSVLERVAPVAPVRVVEPPSLWARFGTWLDEMLGSHRWQAAAALAAVVLLLVAGPLVWNSQQGTSLEAQGPLLAGGAGMASIIDVATPEDTDAMIINTASGTTVIYVQGN
jgi:anti-sigma factor RsiW